MIRRTYAGSCHCGAVRFEVETALQEFTTCDCSLCSRRNALMVRVHENALRILTGADTLTLYTWNMKIARHYFCRVCGIYTFHRKRAMPDHFGVNVSCLEDVPVASVPVRRTDGATMSVLTPDADGGWPGPRTSVAETVPEATPEPAGE